MPPALTTGSVTGGDDRVNAKDGLDTASAIAAPAMAARTPLVIRRGLMVPSMLPSDWKFRVCRWTGLKRSKSAFVLLFYQKDFENLAYFRRALRLIHELKQVET